MNDIERREEGLTKPLVFLGFVGLVQFVAGLFALTLCYGVVVLIFRYAFHVELWNPFR